MAHSPLQPKTPSCFAYHAATCRPAAEFSLRLATPSGYDVYKTQLASRSLHVLAGTARFRWQQMIPPVCALRYSITFRTLRAVP